MWAACGSGTRPRDRRRSHTCSRCGTVGAFEAGVWALRPGPAPREGGAHGRAWQPNCSFWTKPVRWSTGQRGGGALMTEARSGSSDRCVADVPNRWWGVPAFGNSTVATATWPMASRAVCAERGRAEDACRKPFVDLARPHGVSDRSRHGRGVAADDSRYRAIDTFRRRRPQWTTDEALHAHAAPVDVAEDAVAAASAPDLLAVLARPPSKQLEVITPPACPTARPRAAWNYLPEPVKGPDASRLTSAARQP
jgi:hypothetical protein